MTSRVDERRALEALGDVIGPIFVQIAEPLAPEQAQELEPLIDVHMEAVYEARTQEPAVDIALADEIAGACKVLLRTYSDLDESGRAAVVGAVRYFIKTSDADNDLRSARGFDDDMAVVNHVIELTGSPITPIGTR